MLRNIFVVFVSCVLVWDFLTAEPGQSAVSRATQILIERAGEELRALSERASRNDIVGQSDPESEPQLGLRSFFSVFSRPAVDQFISEASAETGVAVHYLQHLAERESAFNPVAEAGTSSASGLYQFVEQTWFDLYDRHGARYDQLENARKIVVDVNGRRTVADPRLRETILNLRFDPKLSTFLAAQYTLENKRSLERSLNRQVNYAELYVAHFLGARGAVRLFRANARTPNAVGADLFPGAARANRKFFYDRRGNPVSVNTLHESLLALCIDLEPHVALLDVTQLRRVV